MRFFSIALILALLLAVQTLSAEAWVRGSAMVVEASEGVEVRVPADGVTYDHFDQPAYFSGIFSSHAKSMASALFHTSNGMTLAFKGEGHFSVERFEGLFGTEKTAGQDQLAETRSRIILNLRRGELVIDSRSLTADSKFVVETPFGRISSVKAILMIKIDFDYRSGIYDFTISCAEGTVRLSDLSKQLYTIYAGQRIAGAGSYVAPAIEVGDQTDDIREKFEVFFKTLQKYDFKNFDQSKLQAQIRALPNVQNATTTSPRLPAEQSTNKSQRPLVIEFAPQAKAFTPYRGEVKPPSEYQADLF